jgi:hypothetical protein
MNNRTYYIIKLSHGDESWFYMDDYSRVAHFDTAEIAKAVIQETLQAAKNISSGTVIRVVETEEPMYIDIQKN